MVSVEQAIAVGGLPLRRQTTESDRLFHNLRLNESSHFLDTALEWAREADRRYRTVGHIWRGDTPM
jgi:hypothetical protein